MECKEEESDPLLAEMTAPSPTPQDPKASAAKVKKEKGKDKPLTPDVLQVRSGQLTLVDSIHSTRLL